MAVKAFDPARDGRVAVLLEVGRRLKQEFPEADVSIPVAGPFSIAFNLRGISGLCEDTITRAGDTAKMLMRLAENQAVLCRAIAKAGLNVAFFESAAAPPILSPRQFQEVELPALKRVLALAAGCIGHPVPCIMGGNTFPILDAILSTGTNYLVLQRRRAGGLRERLRRDVVRRPGELHRPGEEKPCTPSPVRSRLIMAPGSIG